MPRLLYRFGDCTVDPAARELRRAGRLQVLSPKVFDCIAYLIQHRDRAVGRDELIAAVWARLDVSDALLGQAVLKARRAVADSGDEQGAIRTIPRFGYRWVAEVELEQLPELPRGAAAETRSVAAADAAVVEPDSAVEAAQEATQAKPSLGNARYRTWFAVAALSLALVLLWLAFGRGTAPVSPPPGAAGANGEVTAVLPVAVDADPEWSWLRLGMMDLVAERLRSAGLTVVPSDNIVAVLNAAGAEPNDAAKAVQEATAAQRLIIPKAARTAAGWLVRFEIRAESDAIEIEARDVDAMVAARVAVKQLLNRLGAPGAADDAAHSSSLASLVQHAEAALLSDDLDSARRIIETAPAALREAPELRLRLAQIDLRAGRIAAARQRLDALLAAVPPETDPVLRARALTALGVAANHSGDLDIALRTCAEALALLANRSEPAAAGRAYTGCGVANGSAGRFDAAAADFARARIALEISADTLSIARVEGNEGMLETLRGRYADAIATMRRAEERFRRFGARNEVALSIRDQVDAHLALLQPSEALAASERGWNELPRLENVDVRRGLQIQRARALAANGRIGEAVVLLAAAADAATPGQEAPLQGQLRASQARLELDGGHPETAIAHAREAVAALAKADDARERSIAWLTLIRALRLANQTAEAKAESQRFGDWARSAKVAAAPVHATLAEAETLLADQPAAAAASYEQALRAAEAAGIAADTVAVATSWGGALIDRGELERAGIVIGRIARWAALDFSTALAQVRLYRALGQHEAWQAALQRARALAGERTIPAALSQSARPADIR